MSVKPDDILKQFREKRGVSDNGTPDNSTVTDVLTEFKKVKKKDDSTDLSQPSKESDSDGPSTSKNNYPGLGNVVQAAPTPKITTPSGADLKVVNTYLDTPDQSNIKSLQEKINTGNATPSDIDYLSRLTGKSVAATTAYVKGDNTTGSALDRTEALKNNATDIANIVVKYNTDFGDNKNPADVLNSPESAAQFLNEYRTKLASSDPIKAKMLEMEAHGHDIDMQTINTLVESDAALKASIEKYRSLFTSADKNVNLLSSHIVEKTAEDDLKNGVTRDVTRNKIAQRLDPKGYANAQKALNQKPGFLDIGIDELKKGSGLSKDDMLNSVVGVADIELNNAYQKIATDKAAQAHLTGDDNLMNEAKQFYAKVDPDVIQKYPALQLQQMASELSKDIATQSGQLEGTETNDYSLKITGATSLDILKLVQQKGWLQDPKKKALAYQLIENPSLLKDASFLGGAVDSFTQPFRDLGLSIMDVTGGRSFKDIYSDKVKDELFPKEFGDDQTKADFNILGHDFRVRHITNGISTLAGLVVGNVITQGAATEVGLSANTASRLASYATFGLPSIDANLKDSYNFIDNDAERAAYVTLGAMINGEGGRLLDLGKISRVPGLPEVFQKLSKNLIEKDLTTKAANELLDKGKNLLVDYVVKYGKIGADVTKETLKGAATMAYFTFGNEYNKMAFGDPNTTAENVGENTKNAFIDGIFTMMPFGFVAATGSANKNPNSSYKEMINKFATMPDAAQDAIRMNAKSDQDYNYKMQVINTAKSAKEILDATEAETGISLLPSQRSVYVANKTIEAMLRQKAKTEPNRDKKKEYTAQANELKIQSVATLDGLKFTPTLEPLYDLYEAEKEYNKAYQDFNEGTAKDDAELLAAKDKFEKLQYQYFENNGKPEEIATTTEESIPTKEENNLISGLKEKLPLIAEADKVTDQKVLDYAIDKVSEAPTKMKEDLGEALFKQVIEKAPTEKLQEGLDFLIKNNSDSPDSKILDDVISAREKEQPKDNDVSVLEGDVAVDNPALKDVENTQNALNKIKKSDIDEISKYTNSMERHDVEYMDFDKEQQSQSQQKFLSTILDQLGIDYTDKDGYNKYMNAILKDGSKIKIRYANHKETSKSYDKPDINITYSEGATIEDVAKEFAQDIYEGNGNLIFKFKTNGEKFDTKKISQEYHSAKKNNSNPDLVKAVEQSISNKQDQLYNDNGATQAGKESFKAALEKQKPDSQQGINAIRKEVFGDEAYYNDKVTSSVKDIVDNYLINKSNKPIEEQSVKSVTATNIPDLLKQASEAGSKEVKVTFNEAYDESEHGNLPEKVKESLKGNKESIFDVANEASDILKLVDNKDVKSVEFVSDKNTPVETASAEKESTSIRENEKSEDGGNKPPIEEDKPKNKEEEPLNDKGILNHLASAANIPEQAKIGFADTGFKYKTSSQQEAEAVAKDIIDQYGINDAVLLADAQKFDGDVNSLIYAESLNRIAKQELEAKTPEEKLGFAKQFAEIGIKYDEAARKGGRFNSAINYFYKKSPLGIKMIEETKRREAFDEFSAKKDKPWKEFFNEMMKEPEFEKIFNEEVGEGMKKERAESRKARIEKVDSFFDSAINKLNDGGAAYSSFIPITPKVLKTALEGMKQAYHAGERVAEIIQNAIDYITKELGTSWDSENFKKEWESKLEGEKEKKTVLELSEEKRQKILDRFRYKLKGLSEDEKDEVIRRSFKKLVENGALQYANFKKIMADVLGYGELTPEQSKKIIDLVNDINAVDDLAIKVRNTDRNEKALNEYLAAKKKAEKSATELNKIVFNKPDVIRRLLSVMQLNTLGIPSLINNPIFNIWNQSTVRLPRSLIMTGIDYGVYGIGKLFGKDYKPENNVFQAQREFYNKLGYGSRQSVEQLFTGLTNKDYFQKEIYATQIHPLTSMKELWQFGKGEINLTKSQVIDKTIQSTVGIPAEIIARVLNIGDKPQRFASEGAQAAVFAKNLGLQDIDYKLFMEFPKEEAYRALKMQGFGDEAAMKKAEQIQDRIIREGEESTFQQDNLLAEAIEGAFKPFGKAGAVVKTLNMPFVKIPLNAFWSVYNLANPEVALLQSAVYGIKAIKSRSAEDIQQSKKWFAHAVTGMGWMALVGSLANAGIVNSPNADDTTKKEREGEAFYEQQNSINLDKLWAYFQGKDPSKVRNGLNVDLKWFGNMGILMEYQAQKLENMTPEQREKGLGYMQDMMANLGVSALDFMDKGVFSNAGSLFTAINKGGPFMDNYLLNLMNMAGNIVQPAAFAQISRAQLPYYSKMKADNFMGEIRNSFLSRSSFLRDLMDKYPPAKIGIWGDRLDKKDNTIMRLFGISTSNDDNFAQSIYEDYKKSNNTKFFPPSVKPEIRNNGVTLKLTVDDATEFEEVVGSERKKLVAPYINDMATFEGSDKKYSELSEDEKIDNLNILYEQGFKRGKEIFLQTHPKYQIPEQTDAEKAEKKRQEKENKQLRQAIQSVE